MTNEQKIAELENALECVKATLESYNFDKATREEMEECKARCLTGIRNALYPIEESP